MNEFLRRIRYLLNRRRFDQELANDMEVHREMAASEDGKQFGNVLLLREEAREAWGWMWIDRFSQDLRYAARVLRKSPGFTLAAVLMLAIGIGVNVAAFGFFNLLVLRPLPIREPATLLRFHRRSPQNYAYSLPYPEMAFFRAHSRTLSAILALNFTGLAMEGEEKPLKAHFVTANFFSELGAAAMLGRTLESGRDDAANAEPAVVLGYGFWQRHFGADPAIIGKAIHLNGKPAAVVGVAYREFSGLSFDQPDLWAPLPQQPYFAKGSHLLTEFSVDSAGVQMWGRLQPGLTPKVAEDELRSLAAELRKEQPDGIWEKEGLPSEAGGYAESLMIGNRRGSGSEGRDDRYPMYAMVGALCLLILAVACGNLGSLLLSRGVARRREMSIRAAVGAGSGRLVRQLFTESLLLACLGSAAGVALGYAVLRSLMALSDGPAWLDPAPDWRVMLFAIGVGFVAAILFGLTPALQLARQRQSATAMRQVLVGAQVAASCVLLIVSALLVRALDHVLSTPPGFDYQQVIAIDTGLAAHGYTPAKARTFLDTLQNRMRALPGVGAVSLALSAPLGRRSDRAGLDIDGRKLDVQINRVDPGFFETMKIPLLRGRNLMSGDKRTIIVSQSLAVRLWPGEDPLGKQYPGGEDANGAPVNLTVVGIAGNARVKLEDPDMVEVYYLIEPADLPSMMVLVKTVGPPEGVARSAVSIVQSIDPNIFPEVQLLKSAFYKKLQPTKYSVMAVSVLGLVALLIACLGIVGLVAYAVSQRTKEIGIRMALGATPGHVLAVVLRQFSLPVFVGLAAGIGGAAALSIILRRVLYGISNLDPVAYVAAIAVFVVTVVVAALLPARRALLVDPLRALRYE